MADKAGWGGDYCITCICIGIYVYVHILRSYTHACTHICLCVYICVCIYTYIHIYIYIYMCVYISAYTHTYAHVCIYTYTYICKDTIHTPEVTLYSYILYMLRKYFYSMKVYCVLLNRWQLRDPLIACVR